MSSAPIPSLLDARRRAHAAERAPESRVPEHDRVSEQAPTGPTVRERSAHEGGHVLSLVALQRSAGNAAVTALLAAKARPGGSDKVAEIDAALREARKGEPDLGPLERGLKVAKDVGVQVDIDGAEQKPPASALAVTKTGFGPATVAGKKPVPPPKPTSPVSPLAKAARPAPKPRAGGPGGKAPPVPSLGASAKTGALPTAGPVNLLEPPAPPTRLRPEADPAFTAVTGAVAGYAKAKSAHPPPASKAKEAQDAALAPADDVQSQAKAAKVDTMDAQPAGSFDKKAFIAAVKAAIEAKSPKNLQEADAYKESGKAGQVKDEVKGLVSGNKRQSAEAIESATQAPPDASKAVAKPVAPLQQEDPGQTAAVPATGAVPKPAPAEQLNLAAGKHEANVELADAEVTEGQLAKSNEPEFTGALEAKHEAAQHADAGPAQFRQEEAATLAQSRAQANDSTKAAVTGIHGAKATTLAQVTGSKAATKSQDEAKRAEVSAKVQSIFGAAEAEVKKTLDGIDPKVDKAFEQGEKGARAQFEGLVAAKMGAYKRDRYGGWLGGYRWAKDKLFGMPSVVNEFFEAGREVYLKEMDRVISNVADIVGADLKAAKDRIAKGKSDIAAYVKALPDDLKNVGAGAAKEVGDQFAKLESDVAAKQDAVVDTLATKYVESRQGLDDRIEALQAENKGLVDKAIGAIKDVIQTILKLKDMLLSTLARAAAAIGKIIKDPIGFFGNFVRAVKGGIQNFAANIADHLKKGLQAWLFGALSEGGIELPDKFDLKGVVKLVASIIGLTWASVRSRIVKRIGEPVMAKVEGGLDIIKILVAEGLGGLWKVILEKAGNIKEMVMTQIKDMVITQIVKAGITWLISMLNPVGAFIKACKMIYDVVMFFVEKAAQIKDFIDSILDSVEAIANGGVGAVAGHIEKTLAKMIPLLIGFLASLLGLGGIADKIKKIIETVQKPVRAAVDWVVGKAVQYGKRFIGFAKKVGGKIKAGAKKLGAKVKRKLGIKEKTPEQIEREKEQRLDRGLRAAATAANRLKGKPRVGRLLAPAVKGIQVAYRMPKLELVEHGKVWAVQRAKQLDTQVPVKAAEVDMALVKQLAGEARSCRKQALKELSRRRQEISNAETAKDLTVAIGGGKVKEQGGGGLREAVRTSDDARRFTEAERVRQQLLSEVQKEVYLRDPRATPASLSRMMRSAKVMARIRSRLEPMGIYIPRGGRADHVLQPIYGGPDAKRGQVGGTQATHAEKQVWVLTGAQAIGVSRAVCAVDCQPFFTAIGRQGKLVVIADGAAVRVFTAAGQQTLQGGQLV